MGSTQSDLKIQTIVGVTLSDEFDHVYEENPIWRTDKILRLNNDDDMRNEINDFHQKFHKCITNAKKIPYNDWMHHRRFNNTSYEDDNYESYQDKDIVPFERNAYWNVSESIVQCQSGRTLYTITRQK
jgi:hypothetical protein